MVGKTHLVDSLLPIKVAVKSITVHEHGFRRAMLTLREKVNSSVRRKKNWTAIYPFTRKTRNLRWNVERDYVMISTFKCERTILHHILTCIVMKLALWKINIQVVVLDSVRNPNGYYIETILERLFLICGMHFPFLWYDDHWRLCEDDQWEKAKKNIFSLI